MAQQTINIGTNANDGTGDPLRTAFDKINDNPELTAQLLKQMTKRRQHSQLGGDQT